jgi:hypothetical protein
MKLPFNIPEFGKKEVDEDEAEADSVFDPSELEGDPDVGQGEGSIESETILDEVLDDSADEDIGESLSSKEVSLEPQSEENVDGEEGQVLTEGLNKNSVREEASEDDEDLKFSDDDNDNSNDEDEDEDVDEDEDEEQESSPKKKINFSCRRGYYNPHSN